MAVFPFTHGNNISEDMAQFFIMKVVYGKHPDALTDKVIANYWPDHIDGEVFKQVSPKYNPQLTMAHNSYKTIIRIAYEVEENNLKKVMNGVFKRLKQRNYIQTMNLTCPLFKSLPTLVYPETGQISP